MTIAFVIKLSLHPQRPLVHTDGSPKNEPRSLFEGPPPRCLWLKGAPRQTRGRKDEHDSWVFPATDMVGILNNELVIGWRDLASELVVDPR